MLRLTLTIGLTAVVVLMAAAAASVLLAIPDPGLAVADPDRTAVVDRLGDDHAVLLVESDGEPAEQRVVDPKALPEGGRYEGAVLDVSADGYAYDRGGTERRDRTLSRWFDAVSEQF